MTREEAINRLRDMTIEISDYCNASKHMSEADRQDMETFDMAIKALEQEQYYKNLAESYEKTINKLTKAIAEQEPSYNSVNSLVESKLKNPKAKTFDILHFVADNAGLSTFEAIEKAYNMGVSEQEQVLSKIRAEMFEEMQYHSGTGEEVIQAYADGLHNAIRILDKYKAESDEKENADD